MKKTRVAGMLAAVLMAQMLTGCGATDNGKSLEEIEVGNQVMGVSVHDPSIVKSDGKYYIFGSHMAAAVSEDLTGFKTFADGVNAQNPLFDNLLTGEMKAFAFTDKHVDGYYAVWAPDVMYNPVMEKWVMYFSTSHDYRTSVICMATADQIEGPYSYQESLIYSGYSLTNVEETNFYDILGADAKAMDYMSGGAYNNLKYPNCIDPTLFYDEEGKLWMVYGSWSGGVWLLEIDESTGLPIHPEDDEENEVDTYYGKHILGGLHNSCEGPYILYDEASGYYYLFVSYGGLTREGGYQIRQFRSENVTGPYVDTTGENFGYVAKHNSYGLKMMGNYSLPSLKMAYMAPGHNSALKDEDGKYYLVYHQRFDNGSEYHEPRVHQMFVNEDGWMVTSPFAVTAERALEPSYKALADIAGSYYYVNHGTAITSDISEYEKLEIKKNGTVVLADGTEGTCTLTKDSNKIAITIGEVIYKGVVIEQQDEAGNEVRCITAAGNNNESIWAVFYKN